MKTLDNEIKRLRGLRQNKKLSEEEIKAVAQESLDKAEIVKNLSFCVNAEEKRYAKDLLDKYLSQSSFENEADKDTLMRLIDLEVLAERVKKHLKIEYEKNVSSLSIAMMEQLRAAEDQILNIKENLGLTNKDKQTNTWLEYWKKLEKKCLNYYKEHGAETYTRCPKCQHMYRILMRVSDKEKVSATFFEETTLYNKKLFSLYHEKRIIGTEIAEILGVSIEYIDYIYNELFLKNK